MSSSTRPRLGDVGLAVAYVPAVVFYTATRDPGTGALRFPGMPAALPGVLALAAVLALRRRAPVVALAAVLALEWQLRAADLLAEPFALGIALHGVASVRSRRATVVATAASVVVLVASVPLIGRSVSGAALMVTVAVAGAVLGRVHADLVCQADRALAAERRERELSWLAAERRRRSELARTVHDVVSGSAGVTVRLAQAGRCADDLAGARAVLASIEDVARSTTTTARDLLDVLRSDEPLTVGGLRETGGLDDLVDVARAVGVEVTVRTVESEGLPAATASVVWSAAREAVVNSLKHGRGVRRVTVDVSASSGGAAVHVVDDGRADAAEDAPAPCPPSGHGLSHLRERVEGGHGGTLVVGRTSAGGWCLRVELPLGSPAALAPERTRT